MAVGTRGGDEDDVAFLCVGRHRARMAQHCRGQGESDAEARIGRKARNATTIARLADVAHYFGSDGGPRGGVIAGQIYDVVMRGIQDRSKKGVESRIYTCKTNGL